MATLTQAESRRLYSWWWDSHISPKNSKWLQENLADMDTKVKLMIKLLEEDADSFARRAEMYYKKRPELLKLVEEFYRAYRALAERYDHATGVLRQAHKTMAEAFPNQFALIDDPPSISASVEGEPHTPEMPTPKRAFVEPDDLPKDALSQSAHSHSSKRTGAFSEENDALNSRKGLKQPNEMFAYGEATIKPKFAKVKIQEKEVGNKEGGHEKMRSFQEEVSQLSTDSRNLKSQIKSEVENEIHRLQRSLLRLETEKVTILLQYHNSLEKISNLEKEISHAQVDSEKLKSEMLNTLAKLEGAQGQCSQLETEKKALEMEVKVLAQQTNQQHQELHQKQDEVEKLKCSIQEENIRYTQAAAALHSLAKLHSESLDKLRLSELEIQSQVELLRDMESRKHSLEEDIQQAKEANGSLKKELKATQDELETLKISIQHEHSLLMQAEEALQSLQKLHSQTQEDIKILTFDLQSKVEKLKDMELKGQSLEEKIQELSERNESLNNQVLSSSLMKNDLQLEILSLKETQLKLENEAAHRLHENKSLQQEVNYLKEGIANLDMEYQSVIDQIKAVGLNKESLQVSIKELQGGNLELKVLSKRHEDENMILLDKLEHMERVMEKNTFLEASLSDATIELEGLGEKIRTLEESSESLNNKISDLVLENRSLVLQLETTSKNMEKLSDDNTFLGNALSEANVELEGLRDRLKSLEESSQYLLDENSSLQSEKHKLVLQVENIHNSLEDMKRSYAQLEDKHLNLELEKESTLLLVSELQNLLKLEKQGHETFILSSNNQLATLTNMINLLGEEGRTRNEELESTQHELLNSQTEAFMMQRCILDSKENNLSLGRECQKHVEASRLAESMISQLDMENVGHKKMIVSLSEHNKKLREAIQEVLNSLEIENACMLGSHVYEADSQHTLNQIKEIQSFISDLYDENLILLVEKSVNISLLQQLGSDLAALSTEKSSLSFQYTNASERLLALKSENNDLLQMNEQLRQDILASNLREDNLNAKIDTLGKRLLAFIEGHQKLQGENCSLVGEKQLLEKSILNLRNAIEMLEEENNTLLAEVASLSFLSLTLEKFGHERAMDLRACCNYLGSLHDANNDLQEKLVQKDLELTEIYQKCKFTENENIKLYSDLEGIKMKFDRAMHVNEKVEKKICKLMEDNSHKDKKIAYIHETNQMLSTEINTLSKELAMLRTNKQHLMSELTYEMKNYEEEIAGLWNDVHSSSIHVGIFEEKVLELIGECERLEIIVIVQRRVLEEQIILNNAYTEELMQKFEPLESESGKLRAQLNAYLPLVLSLQRSIASLEGQILSLLKHHGLENNSMQGSSLVTFDHGKSSQQHSEDPSKTEADGVLELQKLQLKVEELHKTLEDYWGILVRENPDVNAISAAIITDVEVLTPGKSFGKEEIQENRCTIVELEEDVQETGKHLELWSVGSESSKGTYELMMKDILLDHASYDVDTGTEEISRNGNRMLELWETSEKDVNNQVPQLAKSPSVITEEDTDYHQTEVMEEEKPRYPSKLAAEKEVAVGKPVAPRKVKDSHQDWNTKILECLASDAQRLSVLNKSVQQLKTLLENSEKNGSPTNMKYDTVRWQLRETEETISQLFDMNSRLTKKAEDCCAASGSSAGEHDVVGNQRRRRVSDRARKGSEKIGRLELELQRIQYVLMKLAEEQESRTRAANRRHKVILRDYLYGKREGDKRKRAHFCSCVQTKTNCE
ncbi:hypothetical protein Taro_023356 [Colocasia esculenta]|uniref:NAB domain-containing protein n=1 Tax=Colocasia esculenta TaxID=4460 RepID=A0A843VB56_COLES|nr:hypothetical protein [Colocasia esculenta]